jgi:hypothetical protein
MDEYTPDHAIERRRSARAPSAAVYDRRGPLEYFMAIDPSWKVAVLGYDHWDVMDIARGSSAQVPAVMTLTAIDYEILNYLKEQDALATPRGATQIALSGLIGLSVDGFNAFCSWLQTLRPPTSAVSQGGTQYFAPQDVQDLTALGIRSHHLSPLLMNNAHWLRYQNTYLFDPNEANCLVNVGGWSSPNPETSRTALRIVS